MTSKAIRNFHATVLSLFVIISLASPFLSAWYPGLFSIEYVIGAGAIMFLTLVSWQVFGGCPFTVWENRLREREKRGSSYRGPCIDHYARAWFDITLPRKLSMVVLVLLFVLLIASGFFH